MFNRANAKPRVLAGAAALASIAAASAHAVLLNPRGTGQVLLYPYYTVNRHQQTVLSVVNTTDHGKLLQLDAYEGYNGRVVTNVEVFLAPHDVWTATIFAPDDAGLSGGGASISTSDRSCFRALAQDTGALPSGASYRGFVDGEYTGPNADTGPTGSTRQREGWFAVYEMAEVVGDTLARLTAHDCAALGTHALTDEADSRGGLYGSAAIVDVGQGTMYAYAADALDAFTTTRLMTYEATLYPNLPLAYSGFDDTGIHRYVDVSLGGRLQRLDYRYSGFNHTDGLDAVSAALTAQAVYAEYDRTAAAGVQSEWVLTFPTKPFYTNKAYYPISIPPPNTPPPPPFVEWFGEHAPGKSCVRYEFTAHDREAANVPGPAPQRDPLCTVTQVLTFRSASDATADPTSRVLGSTLAVNVDPGFASGTAVLNLDPAAEPHRLRPDANGVQLRGLPVIGFEAINYTNANVTPGVLANYSSATPLRAATACVQANGTVCD